MSVKLPRIAGLSVLLQFSRTPGNPERRCLHCRVSEEGCADSTWISKQPGKAKQSRAPAMLRQPLMFVSDSYPDVRGSSQSTHCTVCLPPYPPLAKINANTVLQFMTANSSEQKIHFVILLYNGNCRFAHQCLLPYSALKIAQYALKDVLDVYLQYFTVMFHP